MRFSLCLAVFFVAGCPSATTQTSDAGSDATVLTADSGTDTGVADDAATLADTGTSPCDYVNTIDRTCSTDADCAVGLHQTDCCGNSVMIGYRNTQTNVPAEESACMSTYGVCNCPAMLPTTDSNEMVTDTNAVHAACVSVGPTMVCRTYVNNRPANGR